MSQKEQEAERVLANVTMMGADRTGVIATVTQSLFEAGANIESLEERAARGLFTMSLTASWPVDQMPEPEEDRMRERLLKVGESVGMQTRVRFVRSGARPRMAILVTREPHCFEALLRAVEEGRLEAEPVVVASNRGYLEDMAKDAGLPFHLVEWDEPAKAEERLLKILDDAEVDFVVLARFMRILSPAFVWHFKNRIINIHPSLLPAFPGATPYRQAWERGVRVAGATAHFVTPDLDQGPIIMQKAFNVDVADSVKAIRNRGMDAEAEVLVEAVQLYLQRRLDVHWGRVWTA
jgi:formyltetrahydrofolate deformylase